MQNSIRTTLTKGALPVILIAAVVQGWSLYGLHQAIKQHAWPATSAAWLLALYAFVLFVPLTVQLLSEHARSKTTWSIVAAIGLAYFYFGWHHGSSVFREPVERIEDGEFFPVAFVMGLLWLLSLPFMQARLSAGRWSVHYGLLFTTAWRNKLLLAEVALFTGLFWLLLLLWAMLFQMLGIGYFKELFQEPLFIYPVTTLVFGVALHLIGSVERLTAAILEQLLNVLKWLAILAGIILALFTVALLFKLPGLVFEGQKAIGAAWLLWLVAVMVLLINAAYRDGSVLQPYPGWIALALRCVMPLTVIVAATAMYALIVRARHYGITVERVWAFIVAAAALLYSVGYSISAFGRQQWLQKVGRVNVIVAIALIAIVSGTLTPLLSPYRLAANSQYRMALLPISEASGAAPARASNRSSPLHYLRFDAGQYGLDRLRQLSVIEGHPEAQRLRAAAVATLKSEQRWALSAVDADRVIDDLSIFPQGHAIESKLRAKLLEELSDPSKAFMFTNPSPSSAVAVFVDLNDDQAEELVLLHMYGGNVYQRVGENWQMVANPIRRGHSNTEWQTLRDNLAAGKLATSMPAWKEFSIGADRYSVQTIETPSVSISAAKEPAD